MKTNLDLLNFGMEVMNSKAQFQEKRGQVVKFQLISRLDAVCYTETRRDSESLYFSRPKTLNSLHS